MENAVEEIVAYLSALIAAGAFAFGLYQYYRAQIWKKSEFAAAQLQRMKPKYLESAHE